MSRQSNKIATDIREIANGGKLESSFPVMTATIFSVDIPTMRCNVVLTRAYTGDDQTAKKTPITLNVLLNNEAGMYFIPSLNADCLVMEVDGNGKWELIKASKYDEIVMQADTRIRFNSGDLGGLTNTLVLQTELNKVKAILQHLLSVITGVAIPEAGSGANSALQAALNAKVATDPLPDFSDIEDKTVTH